MAPLARAALEPATADTHESGQPGEALHRASLLQDAWRCAHRCCRPEYDVLQRPAALARRCGRDGRIPPATGQCAGGGRRRERPSCSRLSALGGALQLVCGVGATFARRCGRGGGSRARSCGSAPTGAMSCASRRSGAGAARRRPARLLCDPGAPAAACEPLQASSTRTAERCCNAGRSSVALKRATLSSYRWWRWP